jgi:hypothetical protein
MITRGARPADSTQSVKDHSRRRSLNPRRPIQLSRVEPGHSTNREFRERGMPSGERSGVDVRGRPVGALPEGPNAPTSKHTGRHRRRVAYCYRHCMQDRLDEAEQNELRRMRRRHQDAMGQFNRPLSERDAAGAAISYFVNVSSRAVRRYPPCQPRRDVVSQTGDFCNVAGRAELPARSHRGVILLRSSLGFPEQSISPCAEALCELYFAH